MDGVAGSLRPLAYPQSGMFYPQHRDTAHTSCHHALPRWCRSRSLHALTLQPAPYVKRRYPRCRPSASTTTAVRLQSVSRALWQCAGTSHRVRMPSTCPAPHKTRGSPCCPRYAGSMTCYPSTRYQRNGEPRQSPCYRTICQIPSLQLLCLHRVETGA